MIRFSSIISFILGFLCFYLEFRTIKPNLLFEEFYEGLLLLGFVITVFILLFINSIRFSKERRLQAYLPSLICISLLGVIFIHRYYQSNNGFGKTAFKAYNDKINHGITMDFKTNFNLKITQLYKFGETNYYGKYSRNGDTVFFNINTDFDLASKAIIEGDSLRVEKQNSAYAIYK